MTDLRKPDCLNHSYCDAVLNFRASVSRGWPLCEAQNCEGCPEFDMDEDVGRVQCRRPNSAQHATYDESLRGGEGGNVVLCSECMQDQIQQFPPNSNWKAVQAEAS